MENVTAIIKAFERPDNVRRLIQSIRQFYPTMPLIIVDDSRTSMTDTWDVHTTYLRLPYDSGLSAGRNRAVQVATTPYILLLDDDFVFTKDTRVERLTHVLDTTDYDIVAGEILDFGRRRLAFRGRLEIKDGNLHLYHHSRAGHHIGYPMYDFVLNFFVARRASLLKSPWHTQLKIREHEAFFWQAKQNSFKITAIPSVRCDHFPTTATRTDDMEYITKRHIRFNNFHILACSIIGVETFCNHGTPYAGIARLKDSLYALLKTYCPSALNSLKKVKGFFHGRK